MRSGRVDQDTMSTSSQWSLDALGGGVNKLREQIARILETDEKKMTRTWREMLKTVLAERECMIRKVL